MDGKREGRVREAGGSDSPLHVHLTFKPPEVSFFHFDILEFSCSLTNDFLSGSVNLTSSWLAIFQRLYLAKFGNLHSLFTRQKRIKAYKLSVVFKVR